MFLLFFKRGHIINLNQTAVMTHQVQLAIFILATLVSLHYSIYRKRVKLATSNSENGNDQYCMNVFDCRVWEFIRNTIELGTSQYLKYNCVSENFSVLNNEWFRPQVLGHMVIVFKCIFLAGERLKTACWWWRSWYCFCAWCMQSALFRVGWNWVKLVGGCHNMYQ